VPMRLTTRQAQAFERIRAEWLREMLPLSGFTASDLFVPLPLPAPDVFANARVVVDRKLVFEDVPTGGRVAEVGTQEGIFARFLLDRLAPSELHLFDIDVGPLHDRNDLVLHSDERVFVHEGDSSTLLATFADDYFDVVYVDGDHSYEGARRDADVAVRKVRPGGWLIFNDFTIWSPVEMVDYGVPYVVCDVLRSPQWYVTHFALHPLGYHDIALRRVETAAAT
jgi:SAM-dependent methyltransferase